MKSIQSSGQTTALSAIQLLQGNKSHTMKDTPTEAMQHTLDLTLIQTRQTVEQVK